MYLLLLLYVLMCYLRQYFGPHCGTGKTIHTLEHAQETQPLYN